MKHTNYTNEGSRQLRLSLARQRWTDSAAVVITGALLLGSIGCTQRGPKTYPVSGRVEAVGADLQALAGHTIELALESDSDVRAAGQIQSDGSFAVEMLRGGSVLKGAAEGTYKARLVLADDDLASRSRAAQAVHPRYFQFDKSGLKVSVPDAEVVALRVTRR